MATGFRSIPSLVGQLAAAKQIEAQEQNILASQIAAATQQERLNQLQSPQNQALLQLEQQLQTAQINQKLQDLRNPNAALARQVQEQLALKVFDPTSGIIVAPAGLETQIIASPGAITQAQQDSLTGRIPFVGELTEGQQAAFPEFLPSGAQPRAAVGQAIQPITVGGAPTGFSQDIDRAISGTEALNRAKGTSALDRLLLSNAQREADRLSREQIAREGNVSREGIAATRATSKGSRGLTPNMQNTILTKAAEAGLDPDSPKYFDTETKTYDFVKLSIDRGRADAENKRTQNAIKASGLTGEARKSLENLNAASKQLDALQETVLEVSQTGKTPGFLDNALAAVTAAPPGGFFGSLVNQGADYLQSDDSKYLEGKKSVINSALTKAISGLAVSEGEARRLGFLPRPGESFDSLVRKVGLVEDYINNQRAGLSEGSTVPTPAATAPSTASSTPRKDSLGIR